jgi:hypothetical protein
MIVKIGKKVFTVVWVHYIGKEKVRSKVGEDETIKVDLLKCRVKESEWLRPATSCEISAKGCRSSALSIVHPKDKFDIEKGRKNSLARALQKFDITMRVEFWSKYFGQDIV